VTLEAQFPSLELDRPSAAILRLTLRKAGKLNAVGADLHRELADVWPELARDPSIRAVIVRGADGAFSAGGDLDLVEGIASDYETRRRVFHEARNLVYNIIDCPIPIVSAITGPAVGAGLAIALLADISIATPDARIIDGHTRLGVAAGDHAAIVWPLLCGMAKAKYYLLTSAQLSGEEAERIGLVSLAVDDADLDARALEIATGLAEGGQSAIRWTKRALNLWLKQAEPIFEASLAYEFIGFAAPEAIEGIQAFLDKRKPDFPPDVVV
jgi:enoyl-CoA hydratase